MPRSRLLLNALVLAAALPAQGLPELDGPYLAGFRRVTVQGLAGGNAAVTLLVHHPATSSGENAPLDPRGAPYPLVVFGHGFSLQASLYDSLYRHLATHGFVVAGIATEEGLFTGNLPRFVVDFEATVLGLRAAAQSPSSPLAGAVAAEARANAAGHSFGGAAAIVAAARHPELFASLSTFAATASSPQGIDVLAELRALRVPALHLGASQDSIVPSAQNLVPIHDATPGTSRLLEIGGGTHSAFHERWGPDRLVEAPGSISIAEQQRRIRRVWLPFLEWTLRADVARLEFLLGRTVTVDSGWTRRAVRYASPVLFASGVPVPGAAIALCPTGTPTATALSFVAFARGPGLPTPFGGFALDPATTLPFADSPVLADGHALQSLLVPNDAALRGASFEFQALVLEPGLPVRGALSPALTLRVP